MGSGALSKDKEAQTLGDIGIFLKYDFVIKIGAGATCQVHQAFSKSSRKEVAIKCIVKEEAKLDGRTDLKREVDFLRKLEHPNVIRLYDMFEDSEIVYYVLERCGGGKLFDRLEADIILEE